MPEQETVHDEPAAEQGAAVATAIVFTADAEVIPGGES